MSDNGVKATSADVDRLVELELQGVFGDFIDDTCCLVMDKHQIIGGMRGFGNTLSAAIDDFLLKHPDYNPSRY